MRTFSRASFESCSQSTASSFQPEAWDQPEALPFMMTVDASAIVDSNSTNTPFEFATLIVMAPVVMDPAAVYPSADALRQAMPTPAARCDGEHDAVLRSNA